MQAKPGDYRCVSLTLPAPSNLTTITASPLTRFSLNDVFFLIDQKKYFVLHAPRQTGKTTCLLALMDELNREGKYSCLYCNVEMARHPARTFNRIQAILWEMASRARDLKAFLTPTMPHAEASPLSY